jgi:hypothetical protein
MLGPLHPEERALSAAPTTSRACRFVQGNCNTEAALKGRDEVGEHKQDKTQKQDTEEVPLRTLEKGSPPP